MPPSVQSPFFWLLVFALSVEAETISESYPYMGPEYFRNRFVIGVEIQSDIPLRGSIDCVMMTDT